MNIGMLWYDNDKTDLVLKVKRAAGYYQKKYGTTPNLCFVHPSMLPISDDVLKAGKVEVRSTASVLPNHFWIGITEITTFPTLPKPSPIINAKGYPQNWSAIATALKEWADWKCEHCNTPHNPPAGYCLTVHHLNGDKTNCAFENLLACCQRCHLHIQARYTPGQLWTFEPPKWAHIRRLTCTP